MLEWTLRDTLYDSLVIKSSTECGDRYLYLVSQRISSMFVSKTHLINNCSADDWLNQTKAMSHKVPFQLSLRYPTGKCKA
ncbi:hypothetical protein EB796_006967 [Bugula neritina]|uniref:Uncharacterized protein n=1 Tax=Bugula neritina TaxID=10212 RepID=A0A7J7KAY3_BUGNE|nr:hypothetical protein EB796_006967 [Bugula neritina]